MSKRTVVAALSGGVDSAVAAARVVAAGHDVVGVHMALNRNAATERVGARGCCTVEDAADARRTADILGIPFYVWDFSEHFEQTVVDNFIAEYAAGHTPNPCVRCNEKIKFASLLARARALGFDAIATGHYARLQQAPAGPELHRAADLAKDQSYVLAVMGREALGHALFPLGDVTSKAQVRAEAQRLKLGVSAKPDSHDICFIPSGDTRAWLGERIARRPGPVVDDQGAVVGEHDGAIGYTLGQRKGLRLGRPAADGQPRYVLDVSVVTNTVTVGSAEQLMTHDLGGNSPVWLTEPPQSGEELLVQVRAHSQPVPCTVVEAGAESTGRLQVRTIDAMPRVSSGQTMVLYRDTLVVGCATVGPMSACS